MVSSRLNSHLFSMDGHATSLTSNRVRVVFAGDPDGSQMLSGGCLGRDCPSFRGTSAIWWAGFEKVRSISKFLRQPLGTMPANFLTRTTPNSLVTARKQSVHVVYSAQTNLGGGAGALLQAVTGLPRPVKGWPPQAPHLYISQNPEPLTKRTNGNGHHVDDKGSDAA